MYSISYNEINIYLKITQFLPFHDTARENQFNLLKIFMSVMSYIGGICYMIHQCTRTIQKKKLITVII